MYISQHGSRLVLPRHYMYVCFRTNDVSPFILLIIYGVTPGELYKEHYCRLIPIILFYYILHCPLFILRNLYEYSHTGTYPLFNPAMASSGGRILSTTIKDITNTKLEELSKRRASFETRKSQIISSLDGKKQPLQRLEILINGVKACSGVKADKSGKVVIGHTKNSDLELELEMQNLDSFLAQAAYDPSASAKMMNTWENSLLRHLDMQSSKFQYASLYAHLVTEWLKTEK